MLFWLLGVIPAAIACGIRRPRGAFAAGSSPSAWPGFAARSPGSGRVGRCGSCGRAWRSPRSSSRSFALGVFGVRPGGILGADTDNLATSFDGFSILVPDEGCRSLGGGEYLCFSWDDQHGGTDASRIVMNEVGCWHQVPYGDGPVGKVVGVDGNRRGCVHLDDYL
ncbi:MAG TPA: hypothetical protein VGC32_01110 [Solirubrobacterales bacterium]